MFSLAAIKNWFRTPEAEPAAVTGDPPVTEPPPKERKKPKAAAPKTAEQRTKPEGDEKKPKAKKKTKKEEPVETVKHSNDSSRRNSMDSEPAPAATSDSTPEHTPLEHEPVDVASNGHTVVANGRADTEAIFTQGTEQDSESERSSSEESESEDDEASNASESNSAADEAPPETPPPPSAQPSPVVSVKPPPPPLQSESNSAPPPSPHRTDNPVPAARGTQWHAKPAVLHKAAAALPVAPKSASRGAAAKAVPMPRRTVEDETPPATAAVVSPALPPITTSPVRPSSLIGLSVAQAPAAPIIDPMAQLIKNMTSPDFIKPAQPDAFDASRLSSVGMPASRSTIFGGPTTSTAFGSPLGFQTPFTSPLQPDPFASHLPPPPSIYTSPTEARILHVALPALSFCSPLADSTRPFQRRFPPSRHQAAGTSALRRLCLSLGLSPRPVYAGSNTAQIQSRTCSRGAGVRHAPGPQRHSRVRAVGDVPPEAARAGRRCPAVGSPCTGGAERAGRLAASAERHARHRRHPGWQ